MSGVGVIDIFAGPGGWDQGLTMLDRGDVVGVEWDGPACDTARTAGHRRLGPGPDGDVSKLDPSTVARDVAWTGEGMIAGPPCQSFSMAGKGRGRASTGLILAGVAQVAEGRHPRGVLARLRHHCEDPTTAHVLEPLRWAADLRPVWIALEQVPTALPLWEAFADVLRGWGYSAWAGKVQAERYGVPQTRKRAILIARLDGVAAEPPATHSRYHPRTPGKLDPGVAKWVSMAEALRGAGRPLPGDALRSNYGTGGDPRNRGVRTVDEPAPTITSKVDRNLWLFAGAGATSQHTAGQVPRGLDRPAHTITGKGTAAWIQRMEHGAGLIERHGERPGRDLESPSFTITAGSKASGPRLRWHGPNGDTLRVTVEEAAVLQSFPADYPFAGNKSQRYRQVGDAWCPLAAAHVLQAAGAGTLRLEDEAAS